MALKIHLLAVVQAASQGYISATTACGEPLYRSIVRPPVYDEWTAVRRIGGARARHDRDFHPDRDACQRCVGFWAEGLKTEQA